MTNLNVLMNKLLSDQAKLQQELARIESKMDRALSSLAIVSGASVQALEEIRRISASVQSIEQAVLPPPAVRLVFLTDVGGILQEVTQMNLKVSQKLPLSIAIKDKFGNDAAVDGAPQWSVSDPALADIVPSADGMSAELLPKGQVGSLLVQVSADADLGEGKKDIQGSLPVDLLAGDAVSVEVAGGAPVDV